MSSWNGCPLRRQQQALADHGINTGSGIYTKEVLHALPWLPVIDETQLDRDETKDNFPERVFSLVRWHQFLTVPMTVKHLIDFHGVHRLTLSGHSDEANKILSETISGLCDPLRPAPANLPEPYSCRDITTLQPSLRQFHD